MSSNEEKFTRYMEQYQKLIVYIVRKNLGEEWDAEDIGQETFLRMYKHLDYLNDDNVFFWLVCVANNLVKDYRKKNEKHKEIALDEKVAFSAMEIVKFQESPEKIYEQKLKDLELYTLFKEIGEILYERDPRWCYIMIDAKILGMSSREISKALNISVSYVDVIRSRAKRYVRKRMGSRVTEYFGEE